MVYFKSCRRCLGDRVLDQDIYGWYMLCLACGYVTYPELRTREPRRRLSRVRVAPDIAFDRGKEDLSPAGSPTGRGLVSSVTRSGEGP
jgi:hypothetical protein